jgi:hypothetical protein
MNALECRPGGKHCAAERGAFDHGVPVPVLKQGTMGLATAPLIESLNATSLTAVARLLCCAVPELLRRYA